MSGDDVPLLVLLVVALLSSVFLALAEASLLRVSDIRAHSLAESGEGKARRLARLLGRLPEVLNLILLLALVAQIGAATITGVLAQRWFGNLGVTVASIILTVVLFIYGEAIPKTFAIRHAERTALLVSGPIGLLDRLLRPLLRLLVWVADLQLPGRGITTSPTVTEEELKLLAGKAAHEGEITTHDRELIERAFRFGDRRVDDIMVARPDIVAVAAETAIEEALDTALRSGHRRLPIYKESLEKVVGVAHIQDLVEARDEEVGAVGELGRPHLVVPESKRISRLLYEMQENSTHLAIVVDEYGVTVGLVTIEDVAEELLGSISDHPEEPGIEQVASDRWASTGSLPVEDLAEALGIDLPEGDWNTVAGMLMGISGELLGPGGHIDVVGHRFIVEEVRGRRITRVEIERQASDQED
ncbi:MAG: hemolysin family protein [Acidimicrobiia bacterium]